MSVKENRSGKHTKEWILETACNLFNEHGSQAISTKRIAKEMGISPGNLYYHYKNKEEIIRALLCNKLDELTFEWSNLQIPPLKRFWNIINDILVSWQDHRFFKKELVVLFHNDSELKRMYNENRQAINGKVLPLIEEMMQSGVLRVPAEPHLFESLVSISWLIAEYWLNFLEINDEPLTPDNLQRGADLIIQVWRPYFSPQALSELKRLRKETAET